RAALMAWSAAFAAAVSGGRRRAGRARLSGAVRRVAVRARRGAVRRKRVLLVRHPVQPRVAPAEREQVVVLALLDDPAVLEHDDAVGVADRREPVRDDE